MELSTPTWIGFDMSSNRKGGLAMAMRYGRKILALWADYESRNSWVYVDGGFNWMRLRDDNFDAVQYMTTLAAEAKSDDRFVDIDEDPVGKISQLYVW